MSRTSSLTSIPKILAVVSVSMNKMFVKSRVVPPSLDALISADHRCVPSYLKVIKNRALVAEKVIGRAALRRVNTRRVLVLR